MNRYDLEFAANRGFNDGVFRRLLFSYAHALHAGDTGWEFGDALRVAWARAKGGDIVAKPTPRPPYIPAPTVYYDWREDAEAALQAAPGGAAVWRLEREVQPGTTHTRYWLERR